ncbi:cyclophilin-like fold protein [Streptosporangium sp. NPDC002721]|uniref:cyclophilin-like fold protein n=1 Tax=Streptosporangium sp. NPDC002721 TaxID=3366188 RepID=UPI0036B1868F
MRADAVRADAVRIVLRTGDGLATATLAATPAARGFAAMLPLRLTLHDPMGQAKSGRLPHRIDIPGATRVVDPDVAGIYYWPPSGVVAIVYDDLGRSVPPPGMVRLGSVDRGLDALARAGNRFTVWIDRV